MYGERRGELPARKGGVIRCSQGHAVPLPPGEGQIARHGTSQMQVTCPVCQETVQIPWRPDSSTSNT